MSTSTTNYGFLKPNPSEAAGSSDLAENMILSERALINIELGTATGRDNKSMTGYSKTSSDSARTVNTEGAFDTLTWATTLNNNHADLYDVDNSFITSERLGMTFTYTDGNFEFYHEGYYKITWNLRVQLSGTTHSEGFLRAALLGTDGFVTRSVELGIIGSPMIVPINTMTNLTDIGTEQLVKIVQRERALSGVDGDSNGITTGANLYDYVDSATHFRYFIIGFAHDNTGAFTATPLLDETYAHIEFIRGL